MSLVCLVTMLILLDCKRIVRERLGVETSSYEEVTGKVGLQAHRTRAPRSGDLEL